MWYSTSTEEEEEIVRKFMNHGMDRKEAENHCRKQRRIQSFMADNREKLRYLQYRGLLINYGWKK